MGAIVLICGFIGLVIFHLMLKNRTVTFGLSAETAKWHGYRSNMYTQSTHLNFPKTGIFEQNGVTLCHQKHSCGFQVDFSTN